MSENYKFCEYEELLSKNIELNNKMNLWVINKKDNKKETLLTDLDSLEKDDFLSHFIYNPHLINGKKYEIRLYFLITGFTPLKIYLFNNGFAKFAKEKYNLQYLIKNPLEFEKMNLIDEESNDDKWSLDDLEIYLKKKNIDFNKIWKSIKDIIIKTIISGIDIVIPLIKSFKLNSCNLFEFFGIDFLLDETYKPWLMRIAKNPIMKCNNQIETKIKSKLITDILNIIGVIPFSHDNKFEPLDNPIKYKDSIEEMLVETFCEFERPTGGFERIFPLANNIKYYRKFIEDPQDENLILWIKMLENIGENNEEELSIKEENEDEDDEFEV